MLRALFSRAPSPDLKTRLRLEFAVTPPLIYAIGDVHGCLVELHALEARLLADARRLGLRPLIVLLGDYVDRGPSSKGVLKHLINSTNDDAVRLALVGNHDDAMLRFIHEPSGNTSWIDFGGRETLYSYGFRHRDFAADAIASGQTARLIAERIPKLHIDFLAEMPIICQFPGLVFAHAGLQPGKAVDDHTDSELMWTRRPWREGEGDPGRCVVQGHIAGPNARLSPARLILDTGCYSSGRLTAGRFVNGSFDGLLTN